MSDFREWIKRAEGALAYACLDETNNAIQFEDRCFQFQQAVEKALKAIIISQNLPAQKTHDIAALLKALSAYIQIPDEIVQVVELNDYAVQTRYPGDYHAIDIDEYLRAKTLASRCVTWAVCIVNQEKRK